MRMFEDIEAAERAEEEFQAALKQLPGDARASQAESAKETGNSLLRKGQLAQAVAKYEQGLALLGPLLGRRAAEIGGEAVHQRCRGVHLALCNNLAQTCLKTGDLSAALEHANTVLEAEPRNVKALYRRAVASMRINSDLHVQQALGDLARILELEPEHVEAKEQLQHAKDRLLTFYDLLSVCPEASAVQVRQAYRREARKWHPDKACAEDKALSEVRFKLIAEAYETLGDRKRRPLYNLYLQCRDHGFVPVGDPDHPQGPQVRVPFKDWKQFLDLVERGILPPSSDEWPDDEEADGPLSVYEWLLAGGVVLAIYWFFSWRWQRRAWLHALPADLFLAHMEFSIPVGFLLSPYFFGQTAFGETSRWLSSVAQTSGL